MALNTTILEGKAPFSWEKEPFWWERAILAENSLKPLCRQIFLFLSFFSSARGGVKKIRLRGIPLPLCTRMYMGIWFIRQYSDGLGRVYLYANTEFQFTVRTGLWWIFYLILRRNINRNIHIKWCVKSQELIVMIKLKDLCSL